MKPKLKKDADFKFVSTASLEHYTTVRYRCGCHHSP